MRNRALASARPGRAPLDRLGAPAPVREDRIDWITPIDRSRRYYPERLTPLYHTPVYAELGEVHRRRYNQLTGMYSNELIGFLETFVLRRTLDALLDRPGGRLSPALADALRRFRDDEARHADQWKRLNRLSEPAWYREGDYRIFAAPRPLLAAAAFVAAHPIVFPLVFWIQLAQEERSMDISRRMAALPRGEIEPRYAAVYGAHLGDEVRHVQIDQHLIDQFFARRTRLVRGLNARVFRRVVASLFLAPSAATARIVRRLIAEFPELRYLERRMLAELGALRSSAAYQSVMYSRETTPVTFAFFDRFPEFHPMRDCLETYRPLAPGAES